MTALLYRKLTEADADDYRSIRLEALEIDARYYTADPVAEKSRTLGQWAQACRETTQHAIFGAYDDGKLVATSVVDMFSENAARWGSTYVKPEYRKMHLADKLLALSADWTLAAGRTTAVFTVRADNKRARYVHEKNGAYVTRQEPMRFADGETVPTYWYEKRLNT